MDVDKFHWDKRGDPCTPFGRDHADERINADINRHMKARTMNGFICFIVGQGWLDGQPMGRPTGGETPAPPWARSIGPLRTRSAALPGSDHADEHFHADTNRRMRAGFICSSALLAHD